MKRIIEILVEANLFGFKVKETKIKRTELYYVLKKLEINRAIDQLFYTVTIYIKKDGKIGSSTFDIYSSMSDEEIKDKINANIDNSKYALNEYYELPKFEEMDVKEVESNLKGDPYKILDEIKNAVFSVESEAYLSATEFFLSEVNTRLVNSNGVDVKDNYYNLNIELVPTYKNVETYKMLELESYDLDEIKNEVKTLLNLAIDRYNAKEYSSYDDVNIILENDEVHQLLEYFSDDLTYAAKYQNININEINDSVQGYIKGDKLNLKMVPYYKGCINSRAFDSDGVVLKEVELIKDGIAVNRYGSYRFGYYLKANPSGILPIMVVNPGKFSFNDFKRKKYIRCAKFSIMQLDSNTGFFGGEVRLGYYFDGEKEIPVTGLTVSGNINELKRELYLSKEEVTLPSYHGPKYICIKGMKVA